MDMNLTHTQITDTDHIRQYITGGHAEFTLKSAFTGQHFTYRTSKANRGFFVQVLSGPDNEHDFQYLGMIPDAATNLIRTKASPNPVTSKPFQALNWFLVNLTRNSPKLVQVEFYHTGSCSRCGRKLTTPESITRGIGSVCATRSLH